MKRLFSILMTLCIIVTSSSYAKASEIDYMNYPLPDDALVLYQNEDGIIYQSDEITPRSMNYNGVSIDKDKMKTGSFSIDNPHTIINSTSGTFKIESGDSNVSAEMILYGGASLLADKTIKPADGDVHFSFKSNVKKLTVQYSVVKKSRTHGMRLNCWLW